MATLCYGNVVNGNAGHDADDVLVLAFTGTDAVPGADGADWGAQSAQEFISFPAFDKLGDSLVAKIGGGGSGSGSVAAGNTTESLVDPDLETSAPTTLVKSAKPSTATGESSSSSSSLSSESGSGSGSGSCSWAGHCAGASCSSSSDCDGELSCKSKKCA
jgi:hypothetical protein